MRQISVKEAGRRGGVTTREKHGLDHFKKAAKKAGKLNLEKRGREYFSEMGKRSVARKQAIKEEIREKSTPMGILKRFLTKAKID